MLKIRKRFILFNMLVMSLLIMILAGAVFIGTKNEISLNRFIFAILLCLLIAFLGSYTLSKIAVLPIKKSWQKQLDFTADASHELRTPLAVIRTNLEIAMDNPKETIDSQMKWLENIYIEQQRMERLVADLLMIARADSGEQIIHKTTFILDSLLQDISNKFSPICLQKNINLQVYLDSQVPFYGDQEKINQLIMILLDNAYQYSNENGKILLSLENLPKEIRIKVKDTGIGISSHDKNKVFNRFFRVTNSRKQNPDGAGLGLSIAKLITLQHNGYINVISIVGEGSEFILIFPKK